MNQVLSGFKKFQFRPPEYNFIESIRTVINLFSILSFFKLEVQFSLDIKSPQAQSFTFRVDSSKQGGEQVKNSSLVFSGSGQITRICSWLKKCSIIIEIDEEQRKIIDRPKGSQLKGILRKNSDHAIEKDSKKGLKLKKSENGDTELRESSINSRLILVEKLIFLKNTLLEFRLFSNFQFPQPAKKLSASITT